jgi:hypothetical protein
MRDRPLPETAVRQGRAGWYIVVGGVQTETFVSGKILSIAQVSVPSGSAASPGDARK